MYEIGLDQIIYQSLEAPNSLVFHSSIPEDAPEVPAGAEEDTEVEVMVMSVVMSVVAEEDLVEGAMVITHVNSPSGTEHL